MSSRNKIHLTIKPHVVGLIVALSILIIAVGYFYYYSEKEAALHQKQGELKAIAELKIKDISEW